MTIAVGDTFPQVTLKKRGTEGLEDLHTKDVIDGNKVVMFGIPGAYTGTCTNTHLPSYLAKMDELKAKGVDHVVCLSVNDPFVMKAWADQYDPEGKVVMFPDGNGELTKALGLEMDGSGAGLGTRCKRCSLVIENGIVKNIEIEPNPGVMEVSGADVCLRSL